LRAKMKFLSLRAALITGIAIFMILFCPNLSDSKVLEGIPSSKGRALKIVKEIYREVTELGKYPGEEFIKREFFVGEDDDDTNKDIHVLILIEKVYDRERMIIQVTYMQRTGINPIVKVAKNTRNIICIVEWEKISIIGNDYDEKEMNALLPKILRAIQNKKKILRTRHLFLSIPDGIFREAKKATAERSFFGEVICEKNRFIFFGYSLSCCGMGESSIPLR